MERMKHMRSVMAGILAVSLLVGSVPPMAFAVDNSVGEELKLTEITPTFDPRQSEDVEPDVEAEELPAEDEVVRVSIVLEDDGVIDGLCCRGHRQQRSRVGLSG